MGFTGKYCEGLYGTLIDQLNEKSEELLYNHIPFILFIYLKPWIIVVTVPAWITEPAKIFRTTTPVIVHQGFQDQAVKVSIT